VQLNSITLHGFKSFGNRTEIGFSAGTTVIVGPNGSGKSNIIEALRWATGGGRASQYRADDQTDLIFHGATGKRGVGYAEVEIELQHGPRKIHILRTLNRDGSSRLRLNGRNARFLDLDEELSGSGLGRGSLAIIGQGEISSILTADPASLLHYLAEAAGVARLASRREQAQDRLATAQLHHDRLQDLHDELERHLERLQHEAAAAERHQQLSARKLQLRYSLALGRQQNLAQELRTLTTQEADLKRALATCAANHEELQHKQRQQQQQTAARQEEYRQASARTEAWLGELRLAEQHTANAREKLELSSSQEQQLQADLDQLEQLQPPTAPASNTEQLERQASHAAAELKASKAARSSLEEEFERKQAELQVVTQQFERERVTAESFQERLAAVRQQQEETRARLDASRAGQQAGNQETARLTSRLSELSGRETSLEQQITLLRTRLEAAQKQHADASAEAEARSRAAAAQRQQLETRQGYAQGPRNALTSGIPGVLGSVADLLTVAPEFRAALGAALGRRTEFIVTEDSSTARQVITHIRSAGGFVTTLPLDLVNAPAPRLSEHIRNAEGVLGLALEHAEFADRFTGLFNQLLGSTTIIRNMDDALKLAGHQPRPRLVTQSGELLETYGALSGGRQGQTGILSQTADVEEAEKNARQHHEAGKQAHARLLELQQETRTQLAALQEIRSEREAHARKLAASREADAGREQLITELTSRLEALEQEIRTLQPPDRKISETTLEGARHAAGQLHEQLLAARELETENQRASSSATQELIVLQEQLRAFSQASARHDADLERKAALEQRLSAVQEAHKQARQQLAAASEGLQGIRERRPAELDGIRHAAEQAGQLLAQLELQLADSSRQQLASNETLEKTRLAAARREAQLELASEELSAFPPGIDPLDLSERTCRTQLEEITLQLAEIGPVNHRAASEYHEEAARASQLARDLHDAAQASRELDATLEHVDREVTERTTQAITSVRESFKRHVSELFGETAQADIRADHHEGRPSGLHLHLQPPGKRTRQLNLLSVGERTMGALAFLFALMDGSGTQKLPIAVLDEVDAPLDEANIVRFTRFVGRLASSGTQFILVSHQKTTFEAAEVMWGVTSDQGVSKLFSISRDQTPGT
jgi:chromosome segregation protein